MVNQKKKSVARKQVVKASAVLLTKPASTTISIKPGSFLDRRGGMVQTVQLGKRASTSKSYRSKEV